MKRLSHVVTAIGICCLLTAALGQEAAPAAPVPVDLGTPGIKLQPYVIDHRHGADAVIDLSFLLEAPAGHAGFVQGANGHLAKPNGEPIRFWASI